MAKENKKEELEEKLIEELEDEYEEENKGGKKMLAIGGVVAVVLVIVAIVLSIVGGKKSNTPANPVSSVNKGTQEESRQDVATGPSAQNKPIISYQDDFSRDPDSETARKAQEPSNPYPEKTSGARVPVDKNGNSIEGVPIQKSLMIDDRENPFHALNTIAGEIYDLMEINFYSSQNKALSIGEFVGKARINMPQELLNRLDNSYRIFMYRGKDEKGPGTVIVFKSPLSKEQMSNLMKEWEKTMVDDLRPFIMIGLKKDFVEASGKKEFGSSSLFPGGRFVDFSQEGIVSLNYLVEDGYVIIANSRSSFEKVIEVMKKK